MFGSDEGIILSYYVGEGLGSTLVIDEGADLGSSDISLVVSIMSHLKVHLLRTHLYNTMELCWVFNGTKYQGSTLGVLPVYTEGEALVSEEGMVPRTVEVLGYILVAVENFKFGLDDRAELGSLDFRV